MRSPFKFLDPFTLADKATFFGRDKETKQLYRLVQQTPLLILYGLSGTGKTSLIQCGLAGEFDGPDWLPLWIRHQTNINDSLQATINRLLPGAEGEITDQIWQLYKHYLRPVYLIFDQFEELFILGTPEERDLFIATLKTILDEELPCTVLIVIREEYLGRLYPLEKAIPTLFDFRLRVEPMDNTNVKTVLDKSFQKFNISVEGQNEKQKDDRLDEIIQNVSLGRSDIELRIELPYLQVYLDQLYREDFRNTYPGQIISEGQQWPLIEFTQKEISDFGKIDKVLIRYLDEQIVRIQARLIELTPDVPTDAVRLVLNGFVSDEETKRPVRYVRVGTTIEIEASQRTYFPKLSTPALTLCFDELEKAKLLRFEPNTVEIAHDSLAKIIYGWRTDEQRERDNFKRQIRLAAVTFPKTGEYLTRKQLTKFEEIVEQLEPEEAKFFNQSRQVRDEEEGAESAKERDRIVELQEALKKAELARTEAVNATKQMQRIIDALYFYKGDFALAVKNDRTTDHKNKYGFIDKKGKVKIAYQYDEATSFDNFDGYARVKKYRHKFLLDTLENEYFLAQDVAELDFLSTALDIHDKQLVSIPSLVFNYTQLKILLAYDNFIHSLPAQIDQLTSLQTLYLGNLHLTSLPDQIGSLASLQKLHLSNTPLTSLPTKIGELTNLQELVLRSTALTSMPDQIGQLKNLKYLDWSRTGLASLPDQIGQLKNLQYLNLSGTRLTSLPNQIGQLKNLQHLDLWSTGLTILPDQIGQLISLKKLDLSGADLTSLPNQIGQLTSLQTLDLSFTPLTNLPAQIGELKNLKSLDLSVTSIPAETVAEIQRMLPNCKIIR